MSADDPQPAHADHCGGPQHQEGRRERRGQGAQLREALAGGELPGLEAGEAREEVAFRAARAQGVEVAQSEHAHAREL